MRCFVGCLCMLGAALCAHKLHGPDWAVALFIGVAVILALAAADGEWQWQR